MNLGFIIPVLIQSLAVVRLIVILLIMFSMFRISKEILH